MTRVDLHEALARTTLLVQRDIYPELSLPQIADGLAGVGVLISADAANLAASAAQTAVVGTAIALAQTGARVRLDLADVPLLGPQPPLVGCELATALAAHLGRLPASQWRRHPAAPPDIVVVLGDTPLSVGGIAGPPPIVLRTTGDGWSTEVVASAAPLQRWRGEQPFGALLAACAVSAEVFRAAMRKLGAVHLQDPLPEHLLSPSVAIRLGVTPLTSSPRPGAEVDVVSAGAITNGALFALHRVPGLAAVARIFDDDVVQLSNLNRYPLLALDEVGMRKVQALSDGAPAGWTIHPVADRLQASSVDRASPLAQNVLVGADDIPSRWLAQRHAPGWLCVAGTSHFEVLISEHEPGGPCAGCMHPRDEPDDGPIPTVSFVSLLAGVLQAHRLLARLAGAPASPPIVAWPLALDAEHAIHTLGQSARADCPIACPASRALSPEAVAP
jgi:molybdopterin/thiamine biosynthesis adenylyltransferase